MNFKHYTHVNFPNFIEVPQFPHIQLTTLSHLKYFNNVKSSRAIGIWRIKQK